jgi:prephenate dehydrogenase
VAIVGVGLIGGSIGLALKTRNAAARVVGIGRDRARLDEAVRLGAIDEGTTDLAAGVAGAEAAVVCTPVDRIAADVRALAEAGPRDLLITDAGSTKYRIVMDVERHAAARSRFVAAHPIAGSERQGAAFGRADLFEGRPCVLTPSSRTPGDRVERAAAFWSALGASIVVMAPADHDEALALTSHLPHAVASTLAASVPTAALRLAAGAYRDGTRVAAADAKLWTAIFRENRGPLLDAIGTFQDRLSALKFALMADDDDAIRSCWEFGREHRLDYERREADLKR